MMRKFILLLLFIASGEQICRGQQLSSQVDERFELTSIVCRLAQAPEYMQCRVPEYAKDIDSDFRLFVDHPVIAHLQEIRRKDGVGYDAISSMANAIVIRNSKIRLQDKFDIAGMNDTVRLSAIDSRWTKQTASEYLSRLNDFYRKSRFRKFYQDHQNIYTEATSRMDEILQKIDTQWFEDFFGQPFGTPEIYVSITNGPSNYALLTHVPYSGYGILIGCSADQNSVPMFSPLTSTTIIHELSHKFTAPLGMAYEPQMKKSAEVIAPYIQDLLRKGGYGPEAILYEWLTRLAVLTYLKDHSSKSIPATIKKDQDVGIIWQQRAVDFMEYFRADRARYKTIWDFMPQLVGFFNFTAENIEQIDTEYDNRHPYVVSVYPAMDSRIDISQEVVEFQIVFSEPMATYCDGYKLLGTQLSRLEELEIPADWPMTGWKDEYTYIIRLKPEWIKAGGIHGITLLGNYMLSKKNYPLPEDFIVSFKTD